VNNITVTASDGSRTATAVVTFSGPTAADFLRLRPVVPPTPTADFYTTALC
jgi:hypothetical protein